MNLIFDTNIFVPDFLMQDAAFQIFISSIKQVNMNIYIPRVVYDEVLNKYKERLNEIVDKFFGCSREWKGATGKELINADDILLFERFLAATTRWDELVKWDRSETFIQFSNVLII